VGKLRYSRRLLAEFILFARQNKAWWIVPLVLLLALCAAVIVTSQAAGPFIYPLF
jgi:hypothetical protein